jgi:hypothetical protein
VRFVNYLLIIRGGFIILIFHLRLRLITYKFNSSNTLFVQKNYKEEKRRISKDAAIAQPQRTRLKITGFIERPAQSFIVA